MSASALNLSPRERLVVALDVPTAKEALAMAERLSGRVGMLKVGLELFCAEGPAFVKELQARVPEPIVQLGFYMSKG